MLQNPLVPYFSGILGKIQIFDIIFPIIITIFLKNIYLNSINKFNTIIFILISIFIFISIITFRLSIKHFIFFYLFLILLMTSNIKLSTFELKKILNSLILFIFIILICSLLFFTYSYFSSEDTIFTQVRTGFPYIDNVVRITGPFKPTAKFLSFYLLCIWPFIIIWFYYFNNKTNHLIILSSLCIVVSLFTLGRSGLFTAFLYFSTIIFFTKKNEKFYKLFFLYFTFVIIFLIVFINTILHVDLNISQCASKVIDKETSQYFGWIYFDNSKCNILKVNIFDNTYFILKKIAFNMWLSNPFTGNGLGSFYEHYLTLSEKNELSQNLKLTHFYYPQSQYLLLLAENGILGFFYNLVFNYYFMFS